MLKGFLKEFKEFAVKGNVIDMAVGIIIGGAFSPIVNSLVKDIIMPPIGFVMNNVDFSNLYLSLTPTSEHYSTVEEAQELFVLQGYALDPNKNLFDSIGVCCLKKKDDI